MNATLYIDKGKPFVALRSEALSDGSRVWNIYFRNGDELNPPSENAADEAFTLIAKAIKIAHGSDNVLIL